MRSAAGEIMPAALKAWLLPGATMKAASHPVWTPNNSGSAIISLLQKVRQLV